MNVCGMLIAVVLFAVSGQAHAQNVHGILKVVKGDVQIKAAANGQTTKARIGAKVFPKDVVITAKDSRAKIVMVDNNEINVSPESQIEIQHYEFDPAKGKKEVLLNVIYGKVRAKVEQKYDGKTSNFRVKTPAAVAGVRGTDFLTSYNRSSGASSVVTFHGRVEFGVPGPGGSIANAVFVTPGTQASTTGGSAPSVPAPVPQEQLAKMDSDTKTETPKVDGAKTDSGATDGAKDEKKDDSKKDDGAKKDDAGAKKDDSAAKKEDTTAKKEDTAAKKEDGPAKKEDAGAKKDDSSAKKEDSGTAKKDAPAAKKDGPGAKSGSAAAGGSGTTGGSAEGSTTSTDGKKSDSPASRQPSSVSSGGGNPGGPSGTVSIDPSRDVVGGGAPPVQAPVLITAPAPVVNAPVVKDVTKDISTIINSGPVSDAITNTKSKLVITIK